MFLTISTGKSRKATDWKPEVITWESLVEKLRSPITTSETMAEYQAMEKSAKAEAKDVGGFIGGKCENGSRKAENISKRQIIALDADFASLDFWDDFTMEMECAACMYSTHSHTPEHQRYRLLIPLSREVTPTEYEAVARMIAKDLGLEQFDDTTYEANRLMYWPSVCADGLKTYQFESQEGEILNPDTILEKYENWHDQKQWPRSERVKEEIREKAKKAAKAVAPTASLTASVEATVTSPHSAESARATAKAAGHQATARALAETTRALAVNPHSAVNLHSAAPARNARMA